MERIILASGSPSRKKLLEDLGISFEVKPSDVDEDGHTEQLPAQRALLLARLKAEACRSQNADAWIIACDTLIEAHDGSRLEKPVDADDARRMITLQSGTYSLVHSGLCIIHPDGKMYDGIHTSRILFKALTEAEIDDWIAHEERWRGRSSAAQIDGPGQLIIERLEGDWTSVVGLPVFLLGELFAKAGRPIQSFVKQ